MLIASILAAAVLVTPASAARRESPEAQLSKMLAGRVAGQPTNCINLGSISSSRVIDGKAIVYSVGNKLYVNEPRSGADWLDDDDLLVTQTYGSQLCSVDMVRLVDRLSGFNHRFVVLGKFVPYTKPRTAG